MFRSVFCLFIIIWIWEDRGVQAQRLGQEAIIQAGWHNWWNIGVESAYDLRLRHGVRNGKRWLDHAGFAYSSLLLALGFSSSALSKVRTLIWCIYRTRLLGVESFSYYDFPSLWFGLLGLWTPFFRLWFGFGLGGVEHGYTWFYLRAFGTSLRLRISKAWLT